MTFRKTYLVLREDAGEYVDGVWVRGARSTLNIKASMQPVKLGQDMSALPEGRKLENTRKLYTSATLRHTEQGDGIQPDIVVHDGFGYEIVSVAESDNGVLPHNKYIAYRAFPVTTADDWLSGATPRP